MHGTYVKEELIMEKRNILYYIVVLECLLTWDTNIVTKNQTPHGRDNASYQHIESDFSRVILFRIIIVGISPSGTHSEQEKENNKDQAGPAQGLRSHQEIKFFLGKKTSLSIVKGLNFYKIIYIYIYSKGCTFFLLVMLKYYKFYYWLTNCHVINHKKVI